MHCRISGAKFELRRAYGKRKQETSGTENPSAAKFRKCGSTLRAQCIFNQMELKP